MVQVLQTIINIALIDYTCPCTRADEEQYEPK